MTCAHGMPSPASCVECMDAGPVAAPRPAPEQKLRADGQWIVARYDARCARKREHRIDVGDRIGHVPDVGWCCEECAV